ncbi:MAG: hypothetical protein Q8L55_10285 [Phycisphaerales bacterium]|nr:hypothetical protein [Phycisphaerales bacterium]
MPLRAAVAWLLALLCLLIPHAHADEARIAGVKVGYDGLVPSERWAPLWVTIQPGDEAQSLTLRATYEQDPTQRAVMLTPVTTTPGRTITVPLLVCPPRFVDRITVELSGGRRTSSVTFARAPRKDELSLDQPLETGALVVGTFGVRLSESAITEWKARAVSNWSGGLEHAALVALRPGDIGTSWACFDGLNVLVARLSSLDTLPAASLDALAAWVSGGGRIVIVADAPGGTWRRFVPPGVGLSDARPVKPPAGLADLLDENWSVAEAVPARTVTVSGQATLRGWSLEQPLEGGGALIASGPFGGGLATVVAFDPSLACADYSDAAVAPLWASLLRSILPDQASTLRPGENSGYMISSGDGAIGAAALVSAVDALCDVPPIPVWVYALLVSLSALLALAVSAGDYILLGRFKSRHRSWMTAAAWVSVFGLVAWALPNMVRREATTLGRAVVIDALPALERAPTTAWRSGVTSIFAATSASAPLTPALSPAPAVPGLDGYWRGVSVLGVYAYQSERRSERSTVPLPLLQRISALDGSSAASVPPPGGIQLRQWTLRTLQDVGMVKGHPRVTFAEGGDRGTFTVTGLPVRAVLRSGAVQTAAGWASLQPTGDGPAAASALRLVVSGRPSPDLVGWRAAPPAPDDAAHAVSAADTPRPGSGARYLLLDGTRRRTPAFDALAAAGNYAVVHLLLDGPADITTTVPHQSRGVLLYRIAVPLTDPAPPATP